MVAKERWIYGAVIVLVIAAAALGPDAYVKLGITGVVLVIIYFLHD